jgi:hypothetical protein
MIIGIFINTKYPATAQKFRPLTLKVSNMTFPITIALIVIINTSGLASLFWFARNHNKYHKLTSSLETFS